MSYVTPLTLEPQSEDDPATHVSRVNGLYDLKKSTVAAVVWNRSIPDSARIWFKWVDANTLPWARMKCMPRDVSAVTRQACDESGLPDYEARDWFIKDVAAIEECFAGVMSARRLQIRFDIITGNACRKFHTDVVKARLICTYRGPGTQYGVLNGGTDPDHIFNVQTGCPIILRGTRWPSPASANIRHRSPPIGGLGLTRFNLVIDAIHDEDDDGQWGHVNIHPEWVRDDSC